MTHEFYSDVKIVKGNPFSLTREFYSDYYPFSKNGNEYQLSFDLYGLDPYISQEDDELRIYHKNPYDNVYRIKLNENMDKESLRAKIDNGIVVIQCNEK